MQSFQTDNFETIYIDNLDWKNAKSLKCFGRILKVDTNNNTDPYFDLYSYEYKERKSFIVQINYNPFIIYINLALQLFMVIFLMFLQKLKMNIII